MALQAPHRRSRPQEPVPRPARGGLDLRVRRRGHRARAGRPERRDLLRPGSDPQGRAGFRTPLASKPSCFGAAARDPERPCSNPKLTFAVVPKPVQARKLGNAPCKIVEERGRVRVCAFGAAPAKAKATFALIGDSHASHWRAALAVVARREHWRGLSVTHTSCPLSEATAKIVEPDRSECVQWNRQVPRWLARHPEVSTVFVAEHSGGTRARPAGPTSSARRSPATRAPGRPCRNRPARDRDPRHAQDARADQSAASSARWPPTGARTGVRGAARPRARSRSGRGRRRARPDRRASSSST